MGHSPPGYLSAVTITQVVASDSLLAVCCPGASTAALAADWLGSAFPKSCARSRVLMLLSSDWLCQRQSPLGAKIPPQGAFQCSTRPPAALLPPLLLELPWICFPLLPSSIEKMVVAKPRSERCSTQAHTSRQICNTPFKTCFVLMPKGRNRIELAAVQM